MSENGKVEIEISNGVGTLTFSHPKSNSLPGKLLREIAVEITELGINDEVKVILVKSSGEKAFCAGASFDELISIENFEQGKEFFMGFAQIINAMRKAPKFVVVRVQGKAVGGGVGLVSAADYALAHDSASVKLSELALGIGPFVVGPAVERKMGKAAFTSLTIDTDWCDAHRAKQNGLFVEVFKTIDELDKAVDDLTAKLSKNSPDAMKELKEIFWQGTEDWDELLEKRAEISGNLVLSDHTKNYIKQFKNK